MQRNILSCIFMIVLLVITLSNTFKVASTGAPIGSTGAPGETTCGRSGCHTGNNNMNTGSGVLDIDIPSFNGTYIPGKTYQVTVTIQQQHINRFGFSLSAINNNMVSAGKLNVTEISRTQVLEGSNQFTAREYITYKALGTNPYAENTGKWTFEWQAPEQDEGPVIFYLAAVSANNDGTDKGDEVYTDSLVLAGSSTGLLKVQNDQTKITLYPNPVKNTFAISFINKKNAHTKISLVDVKGNDSYTLWEGELNNGFQTISLERPSFICKGIYLIRIQQAGNIFTQKIITD